MVEAKGEAIQGISNGGIFGLILARGVTNLPSLVVSLLLVDIATSFNVQVGAAGQIRTTSGLLSIIFGLVMGVLSVRYRHRSLLSIGLILFAVSAVASYFSASLTMLLVFYSLAGVALSMVNPMINSLIGVLVQPEKRTTVIGWTVAGLSLIYLAGSLSAGFIAPWGWRTALVLVVVPLSLVTCLLCMLQIPDVKQESGARVSIGGLFSGYGALLRNRSALGCILGTVLGLATWNVYLVYGASYWRQVFSIPVTTTAMAMIFTSLSYTSGSLLAGRFNKRLGFRRLLLVTTGALGGITFFAFNAPSFWVSFGLAVVASFFAGMMITVSSSFSLEQIPKYRGTMMSLHSAAVSTGGTLSAAIGGLILVALGYGAYSIAMGFVGLAGALAYMLLTSEPLRSS
jgi:DHA1 family inner membrane transport protein